MNKKLFLIIIATIFLCECTLNQPKSEQSSNHIVGVYNGHMTSGIGLVPVKTVFFADNKGLKFGKYIITMEGGMGVPGILDEIKQEGPYTYLMSFHHEFGKGRMRILFSEGSHSFKGYWGASGEMLSDWNGFKEPAK
jgi:hypothetical protein